MKNTNVCIVGSCNIDLISYVEDFPKPGETLSSTSFEKGFGGKGANQAVAVAKLGGNSVLISKIGTDSFGSDYKEYLKGQNVQIDRIIQTSDFITGLAMITVNAEGQNTIIVNLGANMQFNLDDLKHVSERIKIAKILVCQFEIPVQTVMEALKLAKNNNVFTILNPAPAHEIPLDYYEYIDILCPNETESAVLTNVPVTDFQSAATAAKILKERGCKNVIITLGKRGAFLLTADGKECNIEIEPVKAIDCTGAGDCFIGALSYFIAHSDTICLERCVRNACAAASVSVQRSGTSKSFPTRAELPQTLFSDVV